MEAKEFRIGNWYNDKRINRDFAVHEIRKHMIDHGDDDYSPTNINDVRGIELTPEWLERFGFAKHLDPPDDEVFYNLHEILNLEQINENVYAFDYGGTVQTALISKVHQLQNLIFALTGRELELKK